MASTTTATTAPTNCRLLTLPPELRNRIYRFCTVYDDPVVVIERLPSTYQYPDFPIRWKPYYVPALALTNYQIRTEVLSIYYSANTFQVFSVNNFTGQELYECKISLRRERLRHWIKHIGPSVKHLQNITLALLPTPTNEFTTHAVSRAYQLTASINAKGRVEVEVLYIPKNYRLIKFHLIYPRACVCGIEARVNPGKRSKKRMDGKALIEAATEVYEHFTKYGYEVDCKKCGRQVFFGYL